MNNYPDNGYNQGYNSGYNPATQGYATLASRVSDAMKLVYLRMTLALVITAFTALFCAYNDAARDLLYGNRFTMWAFIIVELGLVIAISAAINKMSETVAMLLFFLFAVVNGVTLTSIFIVYDPGSIALTFFITAGTFAAMSVYGYFTNQDLTKMGSILFMALIGLIIASVVNIFLASNTLTWIISFAGVLIFVGLTAWDTQKIKQMAQVLPADQMGRLATIGALSLYLDFINLFLYLLRFFGNSRN